MTEEESQALANLADKIEEEGERILDKLTEGIQDRRVVALLAKLYAYIEALVLLLDQILKGEGGPEQDKNVVLSTAVLAKIDLTKEQLSTFGISFDIN